MSTLGIGLIGCGGMGKGLVKSGQATELGKLVVACDLDEERRQSVAEEVGGEASADMSEVFDRSDVDVIVVATPNFSHCDVVVEAAKTGKPIFCEKPMALSVAECDKMIDACKASDAALFIGQVLRYIGSFKATIELVKEGRIGEPFAIHVARMGFSDVSKQASWRHTIKGSGGTLFEFGVHEIDFIRCVCGNVKSVYAVGQNFMHEGQYDFPDHILLTMNFENGAQGHYANGAASPIRWNECRVWGREGCTHMASWGGALKLQRVGEEEETVEVARGSHVEHEMRLFLEAARDGSPMEISGEEGRANVAVAEGALRSIETGAPVEL